MKLSSILQLSSNFEKLAGLLKLPGDDYVQKAIDYFLGIQLIREEWVVEQLKLSADSNLPEVRNYLKVRETFVKGEIRKRNGSLQPDIMGEAIETIPIVDLPYSQGIDSVRVGDKEFKELTIILRAEERKSERGSWHSYVVPELLEHEGAEYLLMGTLVFYFEEESLEWSNLNLNFTGEEFFRKKREIEGTVNHELRHFVQHYKSCLINYLRSGKFSSERWMAGLPAKGVAEEGEEESSYEQYVSQGIEFYPWLGNEISRFKQAIKYYPLEFRGIWMRAFILGDGYDGVNYFEGIGEEEEDRFYDWLESVVSGDRDVKDAMYKSLRSPFFAALRKRDSRMWKKAVREFVKAVEGYLY